MEAYIKRSEAMEAVGYVLRCFPRNFLLSIVNHRLSITPTADVAPVVRCKDCKFFCIDDDGFCSCDCCGGLTHPDAGDFCSYGERKDGE